MEDKNKYPKTKGRIALPRITKLVKRIKRICRRYPSFVLLLLLCLLFLILLLVFHQKQEPRQTVETPHTPRQPEVEEPVLVTAEQMAQLTYIDSKLGELKWQLSEQSLAELNRVLWEYDIRQPEQISHFLAQATVETSAGQKLTETGDEKYFQQYGYSQGTRGAGYLQLTYEYGQMAFSTWMMKKYIPELAELEYKNPASSTREEVVRAYYVALRRAANLGLDVSDYSRIVYDGESPVSTGADYIAEAFAWESAGYYWKASGVGEYLEQNASSASSDMVSQRIGGSNWQSRREAYAAFLPVLNHQNQP